MYVAAPPTTLSARPKGVSMLSNATVPTVMSFMDTDRLWAAKVENVAGLVEVRAVPTFALPFGKIPSLVAQLVRAPDC